MKLPGYLTISRPHTNIPEAPANAEGDYISLRLEDAKSGVAFCDVHISLEALTYALTNLSHQPCLFRLRDLAHINKRREVKQERVPYDWQHGTDQTAKQAALAPFETEGWQGNLSDLGNHHRGSRTDGYLVTFVRFVEDATLRDVPPHA